jgi:hypothetical protein
MAEVTYYMIQPFVAIEGEGFGYASAIECPNANAAVITANALSRTKEYDGLIAYSVTRDPQTGEREMKVLGTFGDVPDDFSALW